MSDQQTALTRTLVPLIVAWISTTVAKHLGVKLDSVGLTAGVTAGVGFVYYAVVSSIERAFPAFGILLGKPGPATYTPPAFPRGTAPLEGIAPAATPSLKDLLPPGTVITVPDAPPPTPTTWTLVVGPDGTPIVRSAAVPPAVVAPPVAPEGKVFPDGP